MSEKTARSRVAVELACGCTVKSVVVPFPGALMGCTSGLRHGYRIAWVKAIEDDKVDYNRKFRT